MRYQQMCDSCHELYNLQRVRARALSLSLSLTRSLSRLDDRLLDTELKNEVVVLGDWCIIVNIGCEREILIFERVSR